MIVGFLFLGCIAVLLALYYTLWSVRHDDSVKGQYDRSDSQYADQTDAADSKKGSEAIPPGRWRLVESLVDENNLSEKQKEQIDQLRSIGYLTGSKPAPKEKNVTVYKEDEAYSSLNLYTSGHAPEAILMDMNGNVLHTWKRDIWSVWPDYKLPRGTINHRYFRRAKVMEHGDLIFVFEGLGMVRIDKDSNVIWNYKQGVHHDFFIAGDGTTYLLKRVPVVLYNIDSVILEDYICILDAEGKERDCVSILRALENSPYAHFLKNVKPKGDIFHTNTIEILDGKWASQLPAFRKGNALISIFKLDAVCVVDLDIKQVVWAVSGKWQRQHEPSLLDNGNILLFDNRGLGEQSRIIEFDPLTLDIEWEYRGTQENPFYTFDCGTCARLPNGNTLITESNTGRAFEVTSEGTIVWEFFNPHRAGNNDRYIASLLDMVRLPKDFPTDWME
jgi:hypothetical protein